MPRTATNTNECSHVWVNPDRLVHKHAVTMILPKCAIFVFGKTHCTHMHRYPGMATYSLSIFLLVVCSTCSILGAALLGVLCLSTQELLNRHLLNKSHSWLLMVWTACSIPACFVPSALPRKMPRLTFPQSGYLHSNRQALICGLLIGGINSHCTKGAAVPHYVEVERLR